MGVAGGANLRLSDREDEGVSQCEACQAFEKAPHLSAAGASSASSDSREIRANPPPLDDVGALHAMDASPG